MWLNVDMICNRMQCFVVWQSIVRYSIENNLSVDYVWLVSWTEWQAVTLKLTKVSN